MTQPRAHILPFHATQLTPPEHAAAVAASAHSATRDAVAYAIGYAKEAAKIIRETSTLRGLHPSEADTLPRLALAIETATQRLDAAAKTGRVR